MRRIYKDCAANKVKVEFQKEKGGFSTIFYRLPDENNNKKVGERVGIILTQNQQKIVDIISENPNTTARKLSELVGISQRKIEQNIFKLKEKGLLRHIGSNKNGYWELIKE